MHSKAVVRASGQKQAGSSWVGGFGPDLDGFHLKSAHLLGHRRPLVDVTEPARRVRIGFVHDGVNKAKRAVGRAAEAVDVVALVELHAGLAPGIEDSLLLVRKARALVEDVADEVRLKTARGEEKSTVISLFGMMARNFHCKDITRQRTTTGERRIRNANRFSNNWAELGPEGRVADRVHEGLRVGLGLVYHRGDRACNIAITRERPSVSLFCCMLCGSCIYNTRPAITAGFCDVQRTSLEEDPSATSGLDQAHDRRIIEGVDQLLQIHDNHTDIDNPGGVSWLSLDRLHVG